MATIDKLVMFSITVGNMAASRDFYADKLGLKILTDYRQDDENWWVSLGLPDGAVSITLGKYGGLPATSNMSIYFATSDVDAAHNELAGKGLAANPVMDDLYGPGSGVRFFNLADPDGNMVHFVQS